VLTMLRDEIGFGPSWIVADVGCGTGISSRMFVEDGNEVFGVEPNDDMRGAAEQELGSNRRFHSIKAPAEATTLPDASVDLVVAAQAFHWFDHAACAREFRRVLRAAPGGCFMAMWNTRLSRSSPFAIEYDALLLKW